MVGQVGWVTCTSRGYYQSIRIMVGQAGGAAHPLPAWNYVTPSMEYWYLKQKYNSVFLEEAESCQNFLPFEEHMWGQQEIANHE